MPSLPCRADKGEKEGEVSVEEARAAVREKMEVWVDEFYGVYSDDYRLMRQECESALDRLILEVQAEMPCYPGWVYVDDDPDCTSYEPQEAFDEHCPSCVAREQLKK